MKDFFRGYFRYPAFLLLLTLSVSHAHAEYRIRNIYIEQQPVFSQDAEETLFVFSLLNSLHIMTREYVIDDEILFVEGELLDMEQLDETERNLLATGLFKNVQMQIDTINSFDVDVTVVAQDRWTTVPYIKVQTGGGNVNAGGGVREDNFLGLGTKIGLQALHRTENDIGWEGEAVIEQRRIFRSELGISARLKSNRFRTEQQASILKPFRAEETRDAFFIGASNMFGSDFFYNPIDSVRLLPFHERRGQVWYSRSFPRKDRYFITGLVDVNDARRGDPVFRRAMDNSGRILFGFSSLAQQFRRMDYLNSFVSEQVSTGAWGTAVLGKIVPLTSDGEQLYYAGGQIEQAVFAGESLYLSGQLSAGSAFQQSEPRYTYLEFLGNSFYKLTPRSLITARIRQQTAWNWTAFRQLVLDNDAGLRGYEANELTGDNRIVANVEYRIFPDISLLSFGFSGALFYDAGTVWRQSEKLHRAQVHHAAGLGIRIHNEELFGPYLIIRVDVPYNFDRRKMGQIVLAIGQLFPAFKHPQFQIPKIFGEDIDVQ